MPAKIIRIGSVKLQLDNFTISRTALLGITKSGKTYGAKGIVEQLLANDVPVVIFDAIGVWRWLRTAAPGPDGKGFRVVVAGGSAPDIPLTPDSAAEIVRAAVVENIPLVIDLYDPRLSKADWRRIVQKCCHVLLYENKHPRMVVIEEAAEYVPQTGRDIDGATFAAVEKIVRMGGNAQLGVMLLNQRAQEVNKAVLELCDNIVLLRQRGRNAIDSLEKWMDRVATGTVAKDISKSLPTLAAGECWVWTEDSEDPVRTRTGTLLSFHPDRTKPAPSSLQVSPVSTADFVSRLTKSLGKLEVVKSNDGADLKQLQKRYDQVSKELELLKGDRNRLLDHYKQKLAEVQKVLRDFMETAQATSINLHNLVNQDPIVRPAAQADLSGESDLQSAAVLGIIHAPKTKTEVIRPTENAPAPRTSRRDSSQTLPLQVLTAVAQHRVLTKERLALYLGRHPNDKTLRNTLGSLRSSGYLDGLNLTESGRSHLGKWNPLPVGDALREWYISHKLQPAQARLLTLINERDDWSKNEIAAALQKHPNDKTLRNNLGKLRRMGLVDGLQISEVLRG